MDQTARQFESLVLQQWPEEEWKNTTVLVAVSGGADSVSLLRVLADRREHAGNRLVVGHINHGLRGAASETDQRQVELLGQRLGLPVEVRTAKLSADTTQGQGREGLWRRARYQLLTDIACHVGARWVATGHTQDDQVETVLFRILRGTGLDGLAGMPRVRALRDGISLIRPLLHVARSRVEAYLQAIGETCCGDASNSDLSLTRNRLRQQLLPLLRSDFNHRVDEALLRLASLAAEQSHFNRAQAAELFDRAVSFTTGAGIVLDCSILRSQGPVMIKHVLVQAWSQAGFPMQQMVFEKWQALHDMAVSDSVDRESATFPGSIQATRKSNRLTLQAL